MTITEFLTARLDHDERVTYNPALMRVGGPGLSDLVKRARADIAAKRRILARVDEWSPEGSAALLEAVADLASAYSDHPDYREEWRA